MSGAAPIVLAREERLTTPFVPMGGMSRITLAVLAGSAALHFAIVATTMVASRAPLVVPEARETPVEIVQDVPKATQPAQTSSPRKIEPPKPSLPEPQTQARMSPAPVDTPKVAPPTPAATKAVSDEREALRKELAELRAQKAELGAREAPPPADTGMGPLPDSFQAVALPASSATAGEAMGFKDIVFSQLAKAKGLGQRMGLPGTTGVRFSIDAAGGLADVEVVRPSGVTELDREAVDIVRRAAPFPTPPPGAQRNFAANVTFVVQNSPAVQGDPAAQRTP